MPKVKLKRLWQKYVCRYCGRCWSRRYSLSGPHEAPTWLTCSCGKKAKKKGMAFKSRPVPGYIEWSSMVESRSKYSQLSSTLKRREAFKKNYALGLLKAKNELKDDPKLEEKTIEREESLWKEDESSLSKLLSVDLSHLFRSEFLGLENPDDLTYEGAKPYHIAMRYTLAHYKGRSNLDQILKGCKKTLSTGWKRPDVAAGRPESTGTVMGRALKKNGSWPAWRHAKYPNYSIDAFKSAEWCHLQADSLGGPTSAANLVAASYCANTYMAAIEALLVNAKGAFEINVTAYCSSPWIAEVIEYQVKHRQSSASTTFLIDARCMAFSKSDAENVRVRISKLSG